MGEMADFYLAQEMIACPDEWYADEWRSCYGPPLKCRYCGATGLYWQIVPKGVRLYTRSTIGPHRCSADDDFN
jgi:hypothetical protein